MESVSPVCNVQGQARAHIDKTQHFIVYDVVHHRIAICKIIIVSYSVFLEKTIGPEEHGDRLGEVFCSDLLSNTQYEKHHIG